MQDNKNKKYIALLGLLILVGGGVLAGNYLVETWAKYTKTLDQYSQSKQIAKWHVTNTTDSVPTILTFDAGATVDASTLIANRIAPGTKGEFSIAITNDSDVIMDYNLSLDTITKPANVIVKLVANNEQTTLAQSGHITGTIAPNGSQTVNFTWEWPFNTQDGDAQDGDAQDTSDATTANETKNMNFVFSGTATQSQPTNTTAVISGPTYTVPAGNGGGTDVGGD